MSEEPLRKVRTDDLCVMLQHYAEYAADVERELRRRGEMADSPKEVTAKPAATFRPHDQQWLQEMCELVKNKLPENYSFVVFGFPTAHSDRCYYASNATRDSAITALQHWIEHSKKSYLKHEH